jgi:cellulose synthase/poly-beta-1,6-N-acetylglucosamine synthase-like glycosyltransferase
VLLILYAYAGYPLLVAFVSRFYRPKDGYPDSYKPSVTLLIAAYNEEQVISRKLDNTLNLDYPRDLLQIIVAADGSDDRTVEIVKSFASQGVELSYDPARLGKMSAINRAMQSARNEIVVFSDANNDYARDVLLEIVKPYSDPAVGAATGSKLVLKEGSQLGEADGLYWKYESFIKRMEDRIGCCMGVSGEIFSLRRSLFLPPPSKIVNDDFYMAMDVIKRGYSVSYVASAYSVEKMTLSEHDEIIRRTRIFAGQIQVLFEAFNKLPFHRPLLLLMMVSHKILRSFVPLAMIGAFLTAGYAFVFSPDVVNFPGWLYLSRPYNSVFFLLQILFYILAVLGTRIKIKGVIGKIFYLPVFLLNSNYAAWLGIIRYFSGRQTVVWKKVGR